MPADFSDLDQKLFGWVYRAVRDLVRPGAEHDPASVALADVELRLALLASGIAERPLRIEATDDLGGVAGAVIRLPRTLAHFDDVESNLLLYVARTALDATSVRHALGRPDGVDDEVARLAAIALVPWLVAKVRDELPAFAPLFARLARRASVLRKPPDSAASARTREVDGLVRRVLDASAEVDKDTAHALDAMGQASSAEATAIAVSLGERLAARSHPRREALEVAFPFAGRLLAWPTTQAVGARAASERGSLPSGTQRRAKSPDVVRRIELPREREGENPLEHSFEKVHTADTYQGGRKALDGDDQLDEHGDALEELDLREVIRTNEVARSVYQLDGGSGVDVSEAPEDEAASGVVFHYDEWDGLAYRRDFCTLTSAVQRVPVGAKAPTETPEAKARRRRVRKVFEAVRQERKARGRMPVGSEVDLDAVVERHGFVRAGHEGPNRLYIDRPRSEPALATTLLLDLSSSSDAWIDGRRVLDIAREAVSAVASVLDELSAPFSIAGFHSNTRSDCRYVVIKDFAERWTVGAPRLAACEPTGYTRMGPAIRHATRALEKMPTLRKAILMVTDGRPTDFDRYEGRYGVVDVKKAVDEASVRGIGFFALAIAESRAPHLGQMFGLTGFEALARPDQLADRLSRAEVFMRR